MPPAKLEIAADELAGFSLQFMRDGSKAKVGGDAPIVYA
jgi:hypothetical protein